jgi:hypothetical protein
MPLTPFGASVYLQAIDRAAPVMGDEFFLLLEGFEQRSLGGETYARAIAVGGKERPPPPPWVMSIAARVAPALPTHPRGEEGDRIRALGAIGRRKESEWRNAFRDEPTPSSGPI